MYREEVIDDVDVFSVNEDGLYNFRHHTFTGFRIKIVEYNDPAPNSNDSSDWPVLDDYTSSGSTNWETKSNRFSHNLQINLEKNKIYKINIDVLDEKQNININDFSIISLRSEIDKIIPITNGTDFLKPNCDPALSKIIFAGPGVATIEIAKSKRPNL